MLEQRSKGPQSGQTQNGYFVTSTLGRFLDKTASWKGP